MSALEGKLIYQSPCAIINLDDTRKGGGLRGRMDLWCQGPGQESRLWEGLTCFWWGQGRDQGLAWWRQSRTRQKKQRQIWTSAVLGRCHAYACLEQSNIIPMRLGGTRGASRLEKATKHEPSGGTEMASFLCCHQQDSGVLHPP